VIRGGRMRVTYQRSGGLSPALMNRAPRYVEDLAAGDEAAARRLIPKNFFSIASTPERSRRPDMFLHEIVVEDGARHHRVVLADEDIRPSLRPFVEWLQKKAGVE
jgi:hypothetical protein